MGGIMGAESLVFTLSIEPKIPFAEHDSKLSFYQLAVAAAGKL